MKATLVAFGLALASCLVSPLAFSQEAVTAAADTDGLFHSADPKLNTNKQAAYLIIKELIEAGHWERADKYLTERYLQHNPLAKSGRDGVVYYFTQVAKAVPKPIPEKMTSKVVAVVAEGDLVTVSFEDGKADEHWDTATKQ